LDKNNHQGWYGECFVQALAAAAGFIMAKPLPDLAGADFVIMGSREVQDDYPLVRVQVKSWSRPHGDDDAWHYRLTEKQFNSLAGSRTVPAYLFLVVVPSDARDYADADLHRLLLHRAAYWTSLADRPKIVNPNGDRYVPVPVPRENLLTVQALTALCEGAPSVVPGTDTASLAGTP
jgi:hypothetical protein